MELVETMKYKKTEVGMIPSDWELYSFGDIVDYTKGFPFKSKDYRTNGIRIIRVSDTTFDSIKKENGIYIDSQEASHYKNWRLDENDLIFTTVGSKPPMYDSMVGKVIMVSKVFEGSFLNQNAVLIRAKNRTKEKQTLLLNHFRMRRYLKHIELIYRGNANQASITLRELFEYKIPLPPTLAEQTLIANALSDADELISCIEQLIAKKKLIKKGAMQHLLKPQKGWEVKKLGEVFSITAGGDLDIVCFSASKDEKYKFPIYSNALTEKGLYGYTSEYKQNENTITVTARGQVGVANPRNHKYTAIGRVLMLCPLIEVNINFITEYINNFISFNSESTGVPQLTAPQISNYDIIFPTFQEQNEIANTLIDLDTEITALESKLDKHRKIKQGMMQNLLTGKIRLV